MDYYFIINPKSANGKTKKVWEEQLLPILMNRKISYEYIFTEYSTHATALARAAVMARKCKNIIAIGGDGTIHEVVNGILDDHGDLIDPNVNFGVLCSGTGSDFIKTIEIPKDPINALDIILAGKTKMIDVLLGKCTKIDSEDRTQAFSINIASIGLGGDVVYDINNTSKVLGGKLTFLLVSLRQILKHKFYKIRFKADDNDWVDANANVMFMGNAQYNGGDMHSCAGAKVDDGLIDVFYIQGYKKFELLKQINKIYGTTEEIFQLIETDPNAFKYFTCKKVRVELLPEETRDMKIDFDGEIVGKLPLELEVLPKKVCLIIP